MNVIVRIVIGGLAGWFTGKAVEVEDHVKVVREGHVLDPSTRGPGHGRGHSLGIPPENRGVVLSERSESKGDAGGAPGLPGGSTRSMGSLAPWLESIYFFGSSSAKAMRSAIL